MTAWIIWLIVAAVLAIIEVLSQMVWTLCLAIGCAAALAASLCGASLATQLALMAVTAVIAFIVLVPWLRRIHHAASERRGARTGVMADGDNWQAVASSASDFFPVGSRVRIHSYDSIILTVEPITKP